MVMDAMSSDKTIRYLFYIDSYMITKEVEVTIKNKNILGRTIIFIYLFFLRLFTYWKMYSFISWVYSWLEFGSSWSLLLFSSTSMIISIKPLTFLLTA